MKLKVAGGCGEHGRNCFYVETSTYSFLVDCGLMAQEEGGGYPRLNQKDIRKLRYVFLTHSHADHSGAIPWLIESGFSGHVVATKETLSQLPFKLSKTIALSENHCFENLEVQFGKSGHCEGSVWYKFKTDDRVVLFSGDYTEDTLTYQYDPIEHHDADVAIIDCAYGKDDNTYKFYCENIIEKVTEIKQKYTTLLLPVPKFGRGLELYCLLKKYFKNYTYGADEHFICQLQNIKDNDWIKKEIQSLETDVTLYSPNSKFDIVFVSNPQLRTKETQNIAQSVLKDGFALMTGTVEKGTMSHQLLQNKKMIMCRYPVHLNEHQFNMVVEKNNFQKVIAYHCPTINDVTEYEF